MARVRYVEDPFADLVADDPRLEWIGRPAASHALAQLVAEGALTRRHRVLDVGCGRGTDLVALAAWGYRKLHGLDYNRAALRAARARERRVVGKRVVEWRAGTLAALADVKRASFDLVLDVFLLSNLDERHHARYFREIARVLKPGGVLLVHFKVEPGHASRLRPPRDLFPRRRKQRTGMVEGEEGHAPPQVVDVHALERAGAPGKLRRARGPCILDAFARR